MELEQTSEEATGRIRIVSTPAGEAPEWVRQAWVGLTLPCHPIYGVVRGRGVETNRVTNTRSAFTVPQDEAIEVLAGVNPDAADWWRERGFPLPPPQHLFIFGEEEVEIISGVKPQKLTVWYDGENPYK